jgi:integrase/recombinase XerD
MFSTKLSPASQPPVSQQDQFITARKYENVIAKTLAWYRDGFRAFHDCTTLPEYQKRVLDMRERGLSAVSINTHIRCINAYFHWCASPDVKCSPQCRHDKLKRQKEPKLIRPTFTAEQVEKVLTLAPQGLNERRIQVFMVLLTETGLRLNDARTLKRTRVDLDNLLIEVDGKGRKIRRVPISLECRRRLHQ